MNLEKQIGSLVGGMATIEVDTLGVPHVAPHGEEVLSLLLREASNQRWTVRTDGAGSWMPADGPADLVVTTDRLDQLTYFSPPDLVASAGAGMAWTTLRQHLAERSAWVALDPPGTARTVGSVVATGTSGTLRSGYGNVRDHVLGLTLVTGDGRILRLGGIVVKNVAGLDLVRLATGSFGAFGVITSVTFRLRAVPRADRTLCGTGPRDTMIEAAREILATGSTPAALELLSPAASGGRDWALAIRLVGSNAEVSTTRDAVRGAVGIELLDIPPDEASGLWRSILAGSIGHSATVRLGAIPTAIDHTLDLAARYLSPDWTTVTTSAGAIRWSGSPTVEDLRLLRHTAAQQEIPLTIERAPWAIRAELGHFGAYREGVGGLMSRLRRVFDPAGILLAPVEADS